MLPVGEAAVYTVYYQAYAPVISASTPDDTDLGVPREVVELVPLYIGAELYREDDIQMSTQMLNEFEAGLSRLQMAAATRPPGGSGEVRNTSGWWELTEAPPAADKATAPAGVFRSATARRAALGAEMVNSRKAPKRCQRQNKRGAFEAGPRLAAWKGSGTGWHDGESSFQRRRAVWRSFRSRRQSRSIPPPLNISEVWTC